ncbi:MAG TPA: hypothetical protein VFB20_14605 [Burkholderiales bacterium]|nr:hypothetical protein [Burkholderiales bacterium]
MNARTPIAVVALLILAGCGGPSLKPGELELPPKRLEQRGFSFLPPNEPGWLIAQRSPQLLALAKPGAMEGDTSTVQAAYLPLPQFDSAQELTRYVKNAREKEAPSPRFHVMLHEISAQSVGGAQCALSHMLVQDREPNSASRTVTAVLIETLALVCPHPKNPSLGIALTYTHRSYPEDQDSGFVERGIAVLGTLRFSDL